MHSKERTHDATAVQKRQPPKPVSQGAAVRGQAHPSAIYRRAGLLGGALSGSDVLQLQRAVGNSATGRLLAQAAKRGRPQKQENVKGLPGTLRAGVENLSGVSLDDVKVHYNSPEPSRLQALAYAQGADIYVAPGQEEHLPHETWHVVQQRQGRVRPTVTMRGAGVNDDAGLEKEADVMGARALRTGGVEGFGTTGGESAESVMSAANAGRTLQRVCQLAKRKRLIALSNVQDKQFYINYGPLAATNVSTEDSGTDVEYVVGPRSGLYLGSGPKISILQNTINWLDTNLVTSNNWIRGHLLNDWLGGSGQDEENLAPMSHTTNQQWNRNFEQKMKAITERLYSFYYNKSGTNYFVLIGYRATASGTYAAANAHGVTIPNQFDGDYYYAAYDRINGTTHYDNATVAAAWGELDNTTLNAINTLEGQIVTTTLQTH